MRALDVLLLEKTLVVCGRNLGLVSKTSGGGTESSTGRREGGGSANAFSSLSSVRRSFGRFSLSPVRLINRRAAARRDVLSLQGKYVYTRSCTCCRRVTFVVGLWDLTYGDLKVIFMKSSYIIKRYVPVDQCCSTYYWTPDGFVGFGRLVFRQFGGS